MTESDLCIDLVKRSPMLKALQDDALDQQTLERRTVSSQSTSYRIIGWLTELGVIEKPRRKFMLTPAGETVAETVVAFETDVRTILHRDASDSDLLIALIRCSPILEALREESLDRRELEARLGISISTSHRYTRSLGELGLIEKSNGKFDRTEQGEAVTDVVAVFDRDVKMTLRLAPMLEVVSDTPLSCPIEAFADATVTTVGRGDPYNHINRFLTLAEGTDTVRGMDIDSIVPCYISELIQPVLDGMKTEVLSHAAALEDTMDDYPYLCAKICVNGDHTPWLHDGLPFGLAIFDDRVGIGVRESDEGRVRVFIDTDSVAVREWAEAVFESYRADSIRLEHFTKKGLREAQERQRATASG